MSSQVSSPVYLHGRIVLFFSFSCMVQLSSRMAPWLGKWHLLFMHLRVCCCSCLFPWACIGLCRCRCNWRSNPLMSVSKNRCSAAYWWKKNPMSLSKFLLGQRVDQVPPQCHGIGTNHAKTNQKMPKVATLLREPSELPKAWPFLTPAFLTWCGRVLQEKARASTLEW